MKVNGQMVVLAREIRGLTQQELARKIYRSQATITRIEGDTADVPDDVVTQIASTLGFPTDFFGQTEELLGFGSSAYYYRKRADLSAVDRKKIHGVVNVLRINLKKMLDSVEIVPKRPLPSFELAEYGGDPKRIARALRSFWNVAEGPIKNLTSLVESTGSIVLSCDFGTRSMDATSMRLSEMPPLVFMNNDVPGDRWRFTLAHELAHIVMHQVPHEGMEDEADAFAAELLLPEQDMRAMFDRLGKVRLIDLINAKPYWKVSVAALITRAYELGYLNDYWRRNHIIALRGMGYPNEPEPIAREEPKSHANLLGYFSNTLGFSPQEIAKQLKINPQDLGSWHGLFESADAAARQRFRLVQ
jgi:Zn-dependent peptidase ImmA (M78 family)/transcriptional regulator with XRE-family HTH domain